MGGWQRAKFVCHFMVACVVGMNKITKEAKERDGLIN